MKGNKEEKTPREFVSALFPNHPQIEKVILANSIGSCHGPMLLVPQTAVYMYMYMTFPN